MANPITAPSLKDFEAAIALESGKQNPNLDVIQELTDTMKVMFSQAGVTPREPTRAERVSKEIAAEPFAKQVDIGLGTVLPRAAQGIKGLFTDIPREDIEELKMKRQATLGTQLGSMGGDAAMGFALPMRSISMIPGVSRMIPGLAGRVGQTAEMAGTTAATSAALTPEDRTGAAIMGAAGATLPAAVGVVQRALPRGMGGVGAREVVGEQIARDAGDTAQLIRDLRGGYEPVPGVRGSSAVVTQNPLMQTLETGSRVQSPELYRPFDIENARARYAALLERAGTPKEMEALLARRDEITGSARQQAFGQAERTAREGGSLGLAPNLDAINKELVTLAKGEQRGNPAVQKIVKYVQSEVASPEGVTPQQLYTVRKVLTGQLKTGLNEDIGAAAAASRRETMGLVKGIDENLDGLSDGAWSQYLAKYGAESKDINSRNALQEVIDKISRGMAEEGNVPASLKGYGGELPFGRAVETASQKQFGSKTIDQLTPQDRQLVEALKQDLFRSSQAMNMRATGGPGTATEMAASTRAGDLSRVLANQAATGVGAMIGGLPGAAVAQLTGSVVGKALMQSGQKGQEILARLLQDPQAMAAVLEKARRSQAQLQAAKRAGVVAGSAAD
jgi:hypothetical protein